MKTQIEEMGFGDEQAWESSCFRHNRLFLESLTDRIRPVFLLSPPAIMPGVVDSNGELDNPPCAPFCILIFIRAQLYIFPLCGCYSLRYSPHKAQGGRSASYQRSSR